MTTRDRFAESFRPERAAGLLLVVALHAAALWGLWQHRLLPAPQDALTLFVNFITPPAPEKQAEPRRPPPPKPKPVEKPQPRQIVAATPVVAPTDYVAPPAPSPRPMPTPVIEAPPMPLPAGPVALSAELAVACPQRAAPAYPARSRRLGEEGVVVLHVELTESGAIANARIRSSSGFARLDEAALGAVKTWRCTPATRNGQPVRATALQPFNFVLQES
ncbi:MAG: energy transducer TonB [Rhodocyclaceae bacterium]|nr:energy transducer TonB [Rhodocyclaceae bacterium]